MTQKKILVVDDEQDLCEILLYNLKAMKPKRLIRARWRWIKILPNTTCCYST